MQKKIQFLVRHLLLVSMVGTRTLYFYFTITTPAHAFVDPLYRDEALWTSHLLKHDKIFHPWNVSCGSFCDHDPLFAPKNSPLCWPTCVQHEEFFQMAQDCGSVCRGVTVDLDLFWKYASVDAEIKAERYEAEELRKKMEWTSAEEDTDHDLQLPGAPPGAEPGSVWSQESYRRALSVLRTGRGQCSTSTSTSEQPSAPVDSSTEGSTMSMGTSAAAAPPRSPVAMPMKSAPSHKVTKKLDCHRLWHSKSMERGSLVKFGLFKTPKQGRDITKITEYAFSYGNQLPVTNYHHNGLQYLLPHQFFSFDTLKNDFIQPWVALFQLLSRDFDQSEDLKREKSAFFFPNWYRNGTHVTETLRKKYNLHQRIWNSAYQHGILLFHKLLELDLRGKKVLVIGTQSPVLEGMCVALGAKEVVTLEYAYLVLQHPNMRSYVPDEFLRFVVSEISLDKNQQEDVGNITSISSEDSKKFDLVVSDSSIEHSGLGRYGDAVNPYGDLITMAKAYCIVKDNGHFLLGMPGVEDDAASLEVDDRFIHAPVANQIPLDTGRSRKIRPNLSKAQMQTTTSTTTILPNYSVQEKRPLNIKDLLDIAHDEKVLTSGGPALSDKVFVSDVLAPPDEAGSEHTTALARRTALSTSRDVEHESVKTSTKNEINPYDSPIYRGGVEMNAHRMYGHLNLSHLLANWELKWLNCPKYNDPSFVLQKVQLAGTATTSKKKKHGFNHDIHVRTSELLLAARETTQSHQHPQDKRVQVDESAVLYHQALQSAK
ncbi:unnamed protein product [Amoebophrya sp. A120]|nr:unnamed protein product [Amoebophrya sp. A120]|eukprot:GSA120T00014772001.1